MSIWQLNNPHKDPKVIDSCSLFGMMDLSGRRFNSKDPVRAIANMHERGNGLGGGFAVYGLYPEFEDDYALHIMYLDADTKKTVETQLEKWFDIIKSEEVPSREAKVSDPPIVWRYFGQPKHGQRLQNPDDYVVEWKEDRAICPLLDPGRIARAADRFLLLPHVAQPARVE